MNMMTIEDMKALSERLYAEALRYSTTSQIYQDLMDACSIIDHYAKSVENDDTEKTDVTQGGFHDA